MRHLATDSRKALNELIQRIVVFQVLKQRLYWNPCTAENRRAPEDFRIDCYQRLISHGIMLSQMLHRVNSGHPRWTGYFSEQSIRAASSDFETRRLLRQSARHRRERAPGTDPMLVPSLHWYQAYPLSKPGIDLCTPDFLSRSVRYRIEKRPI